MKNRSSTDTTRRRVLKGVALGGGAVTVSHWSKPVVQSVILPAHAETSPGEGVRAVGFDFDVTQNLFVTFPDQT
ncbi:MAG: twin-arginine translocation signal domain-containing protein [Gammaproteobacteria bacterium]|nr:twin-arginine translocation signal domain-containing protein [Gammaproteobacteria bacterium]